MFLILAMFSCGAGPTTGPLAQFSTQVAYDEDGRVVVNETCPVTTPDGTDYSACCPGKVEGVGPGNTTVWCRVEGVTEAIPFQMVAFADGVATDASCTLSDGATWVDYSGCCPDGWDYIGMGGGGILCGR